MIRTLLRLPALHFALLGTALFVVVARLDAGAARPEARRPIVIGAAQVAKLADEHRKTFGAEATDAELAALVAAAADEEMLYREALALGLDRGDSVVEWRIVEKMHVLYGAEAGDAAAAYRRGVALGLAEEDVVVRNTLLTKMRLLPRAASRADEPTGAALEDALAAYLDAHAADYVRPAERTLTQVFLARDRHGDDLAGAADALRTRLVRERATPETARAFGDPFPTGATVRRASHAELAKLFGGEAAAAFEAVPPGAWSPPIASPYGLHLIWIDAPRDARHPPLADVREQVLRAYRADRQAAYLARMMRELRAAYPVEVERDALARR